MENVMMDWLARALHLPVALSFQGSNGVGGGSIQNTASDAIFNSIVAARHQKLTELNAYTDAISVGTFKGDVLDKLVCYTSQESHSSVKKGAKLACCTIRLLVGDEHDNITGEIFKKAVEADLAKGLIPFYICVCFGSTGGCSIDHLTEIGPICQKHNIYCHVDAAYAGSALLLEEGRRLMPGLEYVDSIDINPYKFMLGAPDLACFWARNTEKYTAAFKIQATYLINEYDEDEDQHIRINSIDYRNYGISLSRRFRALKLWFLFRSYGVEGLSRYVQNLCNMAKHLEGLIRQDKRFEIMNDVNLALICFRQKEYVDTPKINMRDGDFDKNTLIYKQNLNLLFRLNHSGKIHLVPGTLKKQYVLRLSVNYEFCTTNYIGIFEKLPKPNFCS